MADTEKYWGEVRREIASVENHLMDVHLAGDIDDELVQRIRQSIDPWTELLMSLTDAQLGDLELVDPAMFNLMHGRVRSAANGIKEALTYQPDTMATALTRFDTITAEALRRVRDAAFPEGAPRPEAKLSSNDAKLLAMVNSNLSALRNLSIIDQSKRVTEDVATAASVAQKASSAASTAAENATTASTLANEDSGKASTGSLSSVYDSYGTKESRFVWIFRVGAFFAAVGGLASVLYYAPPGQGLEVGDAIYRVAVITAIFGLAGYMGKQASNHREQAIWADSMSVQLKTFEAFLSPIGDDDVKNHLRMTFATRVFGSPPQAGVEAPSSTSTQLLESAMNLAAKVNAPKS